MKTRIRWAACAAAALAALCAGPASAMSLLQAYDAALQNDPQYRVAVAEHTAGQENRVLGRAALLPQLSANASRYKNRTDITAPNILGQVSTTHPVYNSGSKTVQLRQPLFNLEAYAQFRQGAKQTEYANALFDLRGQELVLRVTAAYTEALYAREQVRLAEVQHATLVEQAKVNARMFEKGEGTRTDNLETQARLDLAEASLLEARDAEQTALATLSGIVGQEVKSLDTLPAEFRAASSSTQSFEEWRDVALKNNPEIQARALGVEVAKTELLKARAGHAPRLDFIGSYAKNDSETLSTRQQESTQRAIGIQLNVPLFAGGATQAQVRQAVAGQERARAELQAATDRVLVDLRKQYNAVQSGVSRLAALDKAVSSGKLLVAATEQSIKGGVRINLDLLQAQQQLFTSQRDQAQARFNYLLALLRLRAAAGTLSYDDVREVGSYFR